MHVQSTAQVSGISLWMRVSFLWRIKISHHLISRNGPLFLGPPKKKVEKKEEEE
jgi:hypothetical protein